MRVGKIIVVNVADVIIIIIIVITLIIIIITIIIIIIIIITTIIIIYIIVVIYNCNYYLRSDWTIKSKYPPLFTFWNSCVTVRAYFFRYKEFFTILEHLKLKFSISVH